MKKCPIDLVDAAANDGLTEDKWAPLQAHLSKCPTCCERLESATASPQWWNDAARLLDESLLDDPSADAADSSADEGRLFEHDDPLSELKAAGVIDSPSHPEMLGQLGRYAIEREIGSGGMGVVLKGFDAELNRTVAIKVLAPHLARSSAARQRFVREGRAAAAVVHENVVAIHQVDTSGRLPHLVMHFVDGVSLQRHVDTIGPLPVRDALRIAAQSAAGLGAAHRQGIIHRDVKPANILIGGSGQRVWITDFGLARAVDDASLTRTGFIAGTPHYMSPEQARGGTVGPVSDLFSLGAVVYFMLAARPPWRAERSLAVLHRIVDQPHRPLWQINADVPRQVSDLVDRLLSKQPNQRGESAEKIQVEMEHMLSQMQNPDHAHSLLPDQAKRSKLKFLSRPWFVAPATAALTAALIFAFRPESNPNARDVSVPRDARIAVQEYAVQNGHMLSRTPHEPDFPMSSEFVRLPATERILQPAASLSLDPPSQQRSNDVILAQPSFDRWAQPISDLSVNDFQSSRNYRTSISRGTDSNASKIWSEIVSLEKLLDEAESASNVHN